MVLVNKLIKIIFEPYDWVPWIQCPQRLLPASMVLHKWWRSVDLSFGTLQNEGQTQT